MDGIIDADEQRDLDSLSGKLKALRDLARNQRVVVTRNREMWDALSAAKAEFDEGLTVLQTAEWPDLAKLEAAAATITAAVDNERWNDATKVLEDGDRLSGLSGCAACFGR